MKKRILLCATYSVIEPLGLLHLAGLARDEGWERRIHLVKDNDFKEFFEKVEDFKPDVVGFNIYTGNHLQVFEAFKELRGRHPNIITAVGGPHPTYFPEQSAQNADYVVMSEGFRTLRKILNGTAEKGILPMETVEPFPHPDRHVFYSDYPEHAKSRIKSFIGMTGCPYSCTYCYNSSTPKDIAARPEIIQQVENGLSLTVLGKKRRGNTMGGRLFPHNVRTVESVINEVKEVAENWTTDLFYCQDDVHGFDIKSSNEGGWLSTLAEKWPIQVGLPYHAQMRWEMTAGESGNRRLDLLVKAGCFGLTLAIEAANEHIRKEVLDRGMKEDIIFAGMKKVKERGLLTRTEQITGLPYGATTRPTKMNLEADIELVEFNVRLKDETGGPDMAWASTLAPYSGTKLGQYCMKYGHYENLEANSDVPDTFFDRSVLRFPSRWVGPQLEKMRRDPEAWLSAEGLEEYRNQNAELRRIFNFVTLVPDGHILAGEYVKSPQPYTFERLGKDTINHLQRMALRSPMAQDLLKNIQRISEISPEITDNPMEQDHIKKLAGYFGCIPWGELAVRRFVDYAHNNTGFTPKTLSTATRHHLYEEVLYRTNNKNNSTSNGRHNNKPPQDERYPPKLNI